MDLMITIFMVCILLLFSFSIKRVFGLMKSIIGFVISFLFILLFSMGSSFAAEEVVLESPTEYLLRTGLAITNYAYNNMDDIIPTSIPSNNIEMSTNSASPDEDISNIIDGNQDSAWSSYIANDDNIDGGVNDIQGDEPYLIIFNFQSETKVSSFSYYPGKTSYAQDFEIYVGTNEEDIRSKSRNKEFLYQGKFREVKETQYYNLKNEQTCNSFAIGIRLHTNTQCSCGEIVLYNEFISIPSSGKIIPHLSDAEISNAVFNNISRYDINTYTNRQSEGGAAYFVNDGNDETGYSAYSSVVTNVRDPVIREVYGAEPVLIIYKLSEYKDIGGFSYIGNRNGNIINSFEIYIGDSIEDIRKKAQSHESIYHGSFSSQRAIEYFTFDAVLSTKYIALGGVTFHSQEAGCGELRLYSNLLSDSLSISLSLSQSLSESLSQSLSESLSEFVKLLYAIPPAASTPATKAVIPAIFNFVAFVSFFII